MSGTMKRPRFIIFTSRYRGSYLPTQAMLLLNNYIPPLTSLLFPLTYPIPSIFLTPTNTRRNHSCHLIRQSLGSWRKPKQSMETHVAIQKTYKLHIDSTRGQDWAHCQNARQQNYLVYLFVRASHKGCVYVCVCAVFIGSKNQQFIKKEINSLISIRKI